MYVANILMWVMAAILFSLALMCITYSIRWSWLHIRGKETPPPPESIALLFKAVSSCFYALAMKKVRSNRQAINSLSKDAKYTNKKAIDRVLNRSESEEGTCGNKVNENNN